MRHWEKIVKKLILLFNKVKERNSQYFVAPVEKNVKKKFQQEYFLMYSTKGSL